MQKRQCNRHVQFAGAVALFVGILLATSHAAAQITDRTGPPTLGLDQGFLEFDTPTVHLTLVRASQTAAAMTVDGFDFTPGDWLDRRNGNEYVHLGDLTLRWRVAGTVQWHDGATATARHAVDALPVSAPVLAAADLAPTLPPDFPLEARRYWEIDDGQLALRFELTNTTRQTIEIGAFGVPMVFNNILTDRSLDEAHAVNVFYDPYVGRDAGYLQVTRLNGQGPVLLVTPQGQTPFEAYNPLSSDPTPRGITFEGFYEWMVHSSAYAESEWSAAEPWNVPTAITLEPGEAHSFGVRFLVSHSIRQIETTLLANQRPVAVGVPGYVLPMDIEGHLFLKHVAPVRGIDVEPAGALTLTPEPPTPNGWQSYTVRGHRWGRVRMSVSYEDGTTQTIHYKVIKPQTQVVDDLGRFLTTAQWFQNEHDPFGRSPSIISYDYDTKHQVTEDNRAWIAGLGDEGGSGSWVAAIMKQLVRPDVTEVNKFQDFVDGVLWGGLQYADGPLAYAVRKSMFYYQPDEMPAGTYSDSIGYGGWSSWNREHAMSVGRSYNYPHVAAAHWVMYRLARNYSGLVTNHAWDWYLERAHETAQAMVRHAPDHSQFGQMEGTVFLMILLDLEREGWTEAANALRDAMKQRADVWRALGYPYGSEMPWDSTGQEEVYAWCRYFGFDEKALVTLNAILAYMPTVPHWGYNGSARRYWDFLYAGKLRRVERQLHHYGSGLNAIPVLTEFRDHPDDLYLLRVGYGGVMGAIANITRDGFGPSGFHAYPSTLQIDGYSGDYGPGFLGYAVNVGTYVMRDPEFGWLAFGGNLTVSGDTVRVTPLDAARSRVFLAPLGLWLTLDAGAFQSVEIDRERVRIALAPGSIHTPNARLRSEQPALADAVGAIEPTFAYSLDRGAYVIPLGPQATVVELPIRQ